MLLTLKKTCRHIVESGNHYLGALKGNHERFFKAVQQNFQPETRCESVSISHGRVERRIVSLCRTMNLFPNAEQWLGLSSIIQVTNYRHLFKGRSLCDCEPAVRYYISSLDEPVETLARRIREYWHVENKVHYVRDVTQGEDDSRIRVQPLPNLFAIARNLALNLYRGNGFENMAQAQRKSGYGLGLLKSLFRMK